MTAAVAEISAPAKTGNKIAVWEDFQAEIKNRADELASQLPSNVSRDRFINAAIAAVKQTPDILKATPRSLFAAITKAAQDGLMPDGREGIITLYGQIAQWNPMIYGLRKRARELDGIIVDAQVVRENDIFDWEAGDNPRILHKIKLGDRGKMVGAYAIFKNSEEGIIAREVMDAEQIAKVREQSRAKDSLMWTKFDTEAWRKTVARRGIKSVPCSAPLERLVQRDDDLFDFTQDRQIAPPPPPALVIDNTDDDTFDVEAFMTNLFAALEDAKTEELLQEAWDAADVEVKLSGMDDRLAEAFAMKKQRVEALAA
jgi:recombination protein RecT